MTFYHWSFLSKLVVSTIWSWIELVIYAICSWIELIVYAIFSWCYTICDHITLVIECDFWCNDLSKVEMKKLETRTPMEKYFFGPVPNIHLSWWCILDSCLFTLECNEKLFVLHALTFIYFTDKISPKRKKKELSLKYSFAHMHYKGPRGAHMHTT